MTLLQSTVFILQFTSVVEIVVVRAEHSICRVYLFPLELTSGVGYNQTEYQKRSGRDVQVSRRWAGIVALRNALGELKDNLTQSDNPDTIIHRVKEFSSDVTSSMTASKIWMNSNIFILFFALVLDQESHDLGRLMTSLAETKANLAGIPSNGHMCLLCDSAETGAINDMVINAMAEIEQQKSTIQQFSQNIDSPVFNVRDTLKHCTTIGYFSEYSKPYRPSTKHVPFYIRLYRHGVYSSGGKSDHSGKCSKIHGVVCLGHFCYHISLLHR